MCCLVVKLWHCDVLWLKPDQSVDEQLHGKPYSKTYSLVVIGS